MALSAIAVVTGLFFVMTWSKLRSETTSFVNDHPDDTAENIKLELTNMDTEAIVSLPQPVPVVPTRGRAMRGAQLDQRGFHEIHYAVGSGDLSRLRKIIAENDSDRARMLMVEGADGVSTDSGLGVQWESSSDSSSLGTLPALVTETDMDSIWLPALSGSNESLDRLPHCRNSLESHKSISSADLSEMLTFCDPTNVTELAESCLHDNKKEVGINLPNIQDAQGNTPIIWALRLGFPQLVECLLAAGGDPCLSNSEQQTPLHFVCMGLSLADSEASCMVKVLLTAGADLDAPDTDGHSPLALAAGAGLSLTFDALLKGGANIHSCNNMKMTPMMLAVQSGHLSVLQRGLQSLSNSLNEVDRNGWSVLHWAAALPWLSVLKFLIELTSVRLDLMLTFEGETALHVAARQGNIAGVLEMLRSVPASQRTTLLSIARHDGLTAVDLAGEFGSSLFASSTDAEIPSESSAEGSDGCESSSSANSEGVAVNKAARRSSYMRRLRQSAKDRDARILAKLDEVESVNSMLASRLEMARAEHSRFAYIVSTLQ